MWTGPARVTACLTITTQLITLLGGVQAVTLASTVDIKTTQRTIYKHTHSMNDNKPLERHPLNGLFPRTTWISRHQMVKPTWIFTKQEMMGWQ